VINWLLSQEVILEKQSWFFKNGLYYTILAFVVLLHLILLALEINLYKKVASIETPKEPLKVRVIRELNETPLKRQIVQSEDPDNREIPTEKSFLSDKNRKVDRQTKARVVDKFHSAAKNGGAPSKSLKDVKLSDLGAFSKDHQPLHEAYKAQKNSPRRSVSSTNDHLEDIPAGDLTYLNTVEYKYYGFYHRIRQKLEQFWGRSIQETAAQLLEQGRHISKDDNLITALVVTLNELGEIVDINIKGPSGVKELDDAAIDSFNDAGPFPNPPKDLVHNGVVTIEWGFVVDT
jgi:TonB family protein